MNTDEKREHKARQLEKHLRKGLPISARLAEKKFGISGTGFHRTLNRYRQKGMILISQWVAYADCRFKVYRIDDCQSARALMSPRNYPEVV